jgi:uncharacterized protein YdeI (YjbR/CyaY-like superfamily)
MNPQVDQFLLNAKKWRSELELLRSILLESELHEELKWKQPCYTLNGKNVILLGGFKEFCIISFLKGVAMKDPEQLLTAQGENTNAWRVIKFTDVSEIIKLESTIKEYIAAAIQIEKEGVKVEIKETATDPLPQELLKCFAEDPDFQKAFMSLTPGRQRGYLLYFNAPKQSKTRTSRIEQYSQRILNGKGFHDCVCGRSKKMPTCDGSHKYINR